MKALAPLAAVLLLVGFGLGGGQLPGLRPVLGVLLPYAAFAVFLAGMCHRVLVWLRAPVPFRIPTTCGQQRSLPWIRPSRIENPSSTAGVVARVALEVLAFRSLLRGSRAELRDGPRLVYAGDRLLWLAALAFHWALLLVLLRHLRFVLEPVPAAVAGLAALDGFFQLGAPGLYATDIALVVALGALLWRRLANPQVRYLSLAGDYFALYLLLALALSGLLMRHVVRTDVVAVKQLALGLVTLAPTVPEGAGALALLHLVLVSALAAYFPFSKLVHAGGIVLSPTRNLANTSREIRHVNPWNAPVATHPYEAWEDQFRDKIRAAGLPLEKG